MKADTDLITHITWYKSGVWKERILEVFSCLPKLRDKRVCDVGCGIGTFTIETAKRGGIVVGLDTYTAAIQIAKSSIKRHRVEALVVQADAYSMPFRDNVFDIVIGADIIEHLTKPTLSLQEIHRILKRSGILVITTPNAKSLFYSLLHLNLKYLLLKNSSTRVFTSNRDRAHRYVGHCNKYACSGLIQEVERSGFKVTHIGTFNWYWPINTPLTKMGRRFIRSKLYRKLIKGKLQDRYFGHDILLVCRKR